MDESHLQKIINEIARYVIAIALALAAGTLLILARGENPLDVYRALIDGAVGRTSNQLQTLRWATPLILSGIANVITFRAGIWNIGVEGQLLVGALATAIAGYSFQALSPFVHIPLALLMGIMAGILWTLIPAIGYVYFKLNEIITTLMMNYIALLLTEYLIRFHFRQSYEGTGIPNWVTTPEIAGSAKLPTLVAPYQANAGIYIVIVLAGILFLIYRHTILGYEADILGLNRRFAQYGGVLSKRVLLILFLVSGAVAGLTGAVEVLGAHYRFDSMFPKGLGFDGLMVSLLARNAPLGTIPAGLFVGALKNGAFAVERMTEVNRSAINVIQALILLFFTIRIWLPPIQRWIVRWKGKDSHVG